MQKLYEIGLLSVLMGEVAKCYYPNPEIYTMNLENFVEKNHDVFLNAWVTMVIETVVERELFDEIS